MLSTSGLGGRGEGGGGGGRRSEGECTVWDKVGDSSFTSESSIPLKLSEGDISLSCSFTGFNNSLFTGLLEFVNDALQSSGLIFLATVSTALFVEHESSSLSIQEISGRQDGGVVIVGCGDKSFGGEGTSLNSLRGVFVSFDTTEEDEFLLRAVQKGVSSEISDTLFTSLEDEVKLRGVGGGGGSLCKEGGGKG